MNSRMVDLRSICRGRRRAIRGTAIISPAARRAARARRLRPGFVPGALGSDTGGSIRGPAALCGIVGLKPTYGLVSRAGVYANSFTFDHAGPMTWTVEDCAIMLQAIAGHDPKDPASANGPIPDYRAALTGDIRGLRIGIVRHLYEDDMTVAPEVRAALDEAYAVFRSLGAILEDVRIRPAADYYAVKITIAESEQYAIHEEELRARPGDFGADFLGRALPAVLYSGTDYVQAQRERRLHAGGDGTDLREIRCAGHAGGARASAPAGNLADHQLLAEFVTDDAIQCHRRPGAGAMHGVHVGRLAAVVAACRPPIRRGDRAAGRACLRDGDELARPQAASRSGGDFLERTAAGHPARAGW